MSSGRSIERVGEGVCAGDVVGRGLAVGVAARPALGLVAALQAVVETLDLAQVPARDAIDLVRVFDRISRVAEAAKAAAAVRVAESSLWSKGGHRSPAHWMARETGIGVGEAVKLLEAVAAAPVVQEALAQGVVSPRQARAAARADKAKPGEGARLVERAPSVSVTELESDANRVVAAASTESEAEKAERLRKKRMLRTGLDGDGMGYGHWLLEPAPHARLMALIDANKDKIFHDARKVGLRESSEAYAADALAALAARPSRGRAPRTGSDECDDVDEAEDWRFTKVIVRVDATALDRGELADGEVCEIAGQGPIPVDDVWRMIDGDAFVAAIATRGTDIARVVHLGRKPTALQRTALQWMTAGTCVIEGCDSTARAEIDHVADWADTQVTELSELARPCGHHHDLKTHHGYRFGPRLPSGKRRLVPPDDVGPASPGRTPPPALTLVEPSGDATDGMPAPAARTTHPAQGDLFDTG
jgi:hypothetical protein